MSIADNSWITSVIFDHVIPELAQLKSPANGPCSSSLNRDSDKKIPYVDDPC